MAILLEFWGELWICILTSVDILESVFQEEKTSHFKQDSDSYTDSSSFQESYLIFLNNEGQDYRTNMRITELMWVCSDHSSTIGVVSPLLSVSLGLDLLVRHRNREKENMMFETVAYFLNIW